MKNKIPEIIQACLCKWVQVLPYKLDLLIHRAEIYNVPYNKLVDKDFNLKEYVDTICHWDDAHWLFGWVDAQDKLVKDFWFEKKIRTEWFRSFQSLVFVDSLISLPFNQRLWQKTN